MQVGGRDGWLGFAYGRWRYRCIVTVSFVPFLSQHSLCDLFTMAKFINLEYEWLSIGLVQTALTIETKKFIFVL